MLKPALVFVALICSAHVIEASQRISTDVSGDIPRLEEEDKPGSEELAKSKVLPRVPFKRLRRIEYGEFWFKHVITSVITMLVVQGLRSQDKSECQTFKRMSRLCLRSLVVLALVSFWRVARGSHSPQQARQMDVSISPLLLPSYFTALLPSPNLI
jgi:hypothetical protein